MPNPAGTLRVVTHTLALVVLISLADLCLFVALVVKLFSAQAGWKVSCWTAGWFWEYMQHHFEYRRNGHAAIKVIGDNIPEGEAAIVLTNHLSYADFYLTQHLAVKAGMLSRSRYFAKKELVWMIPLFGWAFWAMDMILVSRNWANDSTTIERVFRSIRNLDTPVWVSLSPEGTRRTPQKVLNSQAFSVRNNKPVLHHLLWPRTKGFAATVKGLRGSKVQAVYDLTFLYLTPSRKLIAREAGTRENGGSRENGGNGDNGSSRLRIPSLAELLGCQDLKKAGYGFRIHVRRYNLSDLPEDDEGLKRWCENMWVEKDRLLADMIREEGIDVHDEKPQVPGGRIATNTKRQIRSKG